MTDAVAQRFDGIEAGQRELRDDVRRLDERVDGIDERLGHLQQRVDGIDERLEHVQQDVHRIDERLEHLHQRMGVLHEDVLARIAATGESRPATKREMDQGFADLRELIERRLDPLEATVRHHTVEINRLKRSRR